MNNRTNSMVLCATIAGILNAAAARAQEAATLEEVVVTARKRAESIVDVPLSISAISAEEIEDRGIQDIADVGNFTPGFKDQTQSVSRNDRGFRTYTIRGIISGNALATRQTASVFVDGALNFGGNVSNLADIDHVEVIKGPQSAYFGRGTFAGAINFVTRAPSVTEWKSKFSFDEAIYNSQTVSAEVEGPLIQDKLGVRLSGQSYEVGGNYQDVGWPGVKLGDRRTKSVAIGLIGHPSESFTARTYFTAWRDHDGPAANAGLSQADWNCNGGAAPAGQLNYYCGSIGGQWPRATQTRAMYIDPVSFAGLQNGNGQPYSTPYLGGNFVNHIGLERNAFNWRTLFDYAMGDGYTLSGNVAWDSNKWAFLQSGAYQDTREIPNPFFGTIPGVLPYQNVLVVGNTSDVDQNAEVRLASPQNVPFTWLIGANYFHDLSRNQTCVYLFVGNLGCVAPLQDFTNSTSAVFGSVSYEFWKGFSAIAEARYQWEKLGEKSYAGIIQSASDKSTSFTPRAILQFKPEKDRTYYISYAEGSLPVEFNTNVLTLTPSQQQEVAQQADVQTTVPADHMRMEEIGAKGLYFGDTLQLLASAYVGRWTGRHIPQSVTFTEPGGSLGGLVVASAGGIVDLQGIELEATYRVSESLTLDATAAWNATKIKKTFSTDALLLTGNPNQVGTQLPLYPAETATFSATYQRHAFGQFDGFARLDYFYTSKIYDSEANLAWTAATGKINAGIGISSDRYRIELYGKNLTDNLTPTSLQRQNFSTYDALGNQTGSPNGIGFALPDRLSVGLRISVRIQ